jgi:hypothetical protein
MTSVVRPVRTGNRPVRPDPSLSRRQSLTLTICIQPCSEAPLPLSFFKILQDFGRPPPRSTDHGAIPLGRTKAFRASFPAAGELSRGAVLRLLHTHNDPTALTSSPVVSFARFLYWLAFVALFRAKIKSPLLPLSNGKCGSAGFGSVVGVLPPHPLHGAPVRGWSKF